MREFKIRSERYISLTRDGFVARGVFDFPESTVERDIERLRERDESGSRGSELGPVWCIM